MKPIRLGLVALVATVATAISISPPAPATSAVQIEVTDEAAGTNRLHLGVTHTQHSADANGDREAVRGARELLRAAPSPWFQNQHLMGWGAGNPEPVPGVHDWRSLDARIEIVRDTNGTPIITLAAAPDWMKGGLPVLTDWSRIEEAPRRRHFDDFARLARDVALRYRDVRHFQVWNELKGFWDAEANRWRYEDYTRLYNEVYDAVKAVRPDALVGGPYVVVDSRSSAGAPHASTLHGEWGAADQRSLDVITYWLAHKRGADFIAVDGSTSTRDAGLVTDPFTAAAKYADVTAWIRAQTSLPVVWSEWRPTSDTDDPARQVAVAANALGVTASAGATGILFWQPQGEGAECDLCLWTDPRRAGGGRATPLYDVVTGFAAAFPPGAVWHRATSSSRDVGVLATATTVMLVNRTGNDLAVTGVPGVTSLAPYAVRFATR